MSRLTTPVGVIAVALIVFALTGCVTGGRMASPTTDPSSRSNPSRAVGPSASPTATTASVILSTAGLGPIRMGAPLGPDSAELVAWNGAACPGGSSDGSDFGLWEPRRPRTGQSPLGRDTAFGIVTDYGRRDTPVNLLQVWASDFRTPSGLHVGSTDAEVRRALPAVPAQDDGAARWYSVVDSGWRITFTVANETGTAPVDSDPVQLITVSAASERDWPWWGTDVGAHCTP